MVGLNELPVEILCMILGNYSNDTKQLKQLSLVSRPLLIVCRRYFFTTLRMTETNPSFTRSSRSWRRLFKRSPYVRSYIRTLELGPPIFRMLAKHPEHCSDHWRGVLTSGIPSIGSDVMCQVMASAYNAENVTLRFEFQPWDNYSAYFQETVANVVRRRALTSLNLEDSLDFPLEFLSKSTSLRELSLVSANFSEQSTSRDESTAVDFPDSSEDGRHETAGKVVLRGRLESLLLFSSDDAVKRLVQLSRAATGLDLSGLKRLAVNMTGSDGRSALKLIPGEAKLVETLELRLGLNYSGLDLFSLDEFPNLRRLVISQAFNQTEQHPVRKLLPFLLKTQKLSKLEDLQLHMRCESPYANSCEMTQQDARRMIVSGEWRRLESCLLGASDGDSAGASTESDTKFPELHKLSVVFRPNDVAPFMTSNIETSLNLSLVAFVPRLHEATSIQIRMADDSFEKYT